jgi:hypothetical protein
LQNQRKGEGQLHFNFLLQGRLFLELGIFFISKDYLFFCTFFLQTHHKNKMKFKKKKKEGGTLGAGFCKPFVFEREKRSSGFFRGGKVYIFFILTKQF